MSFMQQINEAFPPKPTFTEKDLSDLSGKVYIVTGGASGVGFELSKLLYSKGATVYIAGRSAANGENAIKSIKPAFPTSSGRLEFLYLDLGDLTGIKSSAETFLGKESRLDVVWHNAGVMVPPAGSKTKQGYELQLGTNVLAPWLFQHFLTPRMAETAADPSTPKDSVRVIWVASLATNFSPPNGGVNWDDMNFEKAGTAGFIQKLRTRQAAYGQSKAGNVLLSAEAVRQWKGNGVLSVSLNPGNLTTQLTRHTPSLITRIINILLTYPPYYGGLTELYAGLSPDINESTNGMYVVPWGRNGNSHLRKDLVEGMKEGGSSSRLWQWCWDEAKQYM